MRFSIRTRLTLWYTTLLVVSLFVFWTALYFSILNVFTKNIDEQIDSVSGMMVHTVVGPSGRLIIPRNFDIILERFFGIKTSGNYIQVLSAGGIVSAKNSSLEGFILPLSAVAFENARKGISTYEVVDTIGRFPVRTITKPVILGKKKLLAIIQVGSSLELMEEVTRYIIYIFLIGGVILVIISIAVGRMLATIALKPVSEITATARRIGASNLHERIDIKGPRDELGRLTETINDMIARLEASFMQTKQFTGDASHELRTPLTVLKGEIEVALRSKMSGEELKEVLVSSLEEIDRMSYIVNNLLELARADAKVRTEKAGRIDLGSVVSESVDLLAPAARDKGIRLSSSVAGDGLVQGEELRAGQLVYNLIDNAIKYTDSGGSVDVSLAIEGDNVVLKVSDTGIGIAADDLAHIFDRFYRVDKVRTSSAGGAGLGLSICKEIAESFSGRIEAESEIGAGTTFTVSLPLGGRYENR